MISECKIIFLSPGIITNSDMTIPKAFTEKKTRPTGTV